MKCRKCKSTMILWKPDRYSCTQCTDGDGLVLLTLKRGKNNELVTTLEKFTMANKENVNGGKNDWRIYILMAVLIGFIISYQILAALIILGVVTVAVAYAFIKSF